MLFALLPSLLIGAAAYSKLYDLIKKNRIEDVGQIAHARHETLRQKLTQDNHRNTALLQSIIASCHQAAINQCIKPKLEQFAAITPKASLFFHSGLSPDLSIGAQALSLEQLKQTLKPGQLAIVTPSQVKGDTVYSLIASDPETGFYLVTTYSSQELQPIFVGAPALGHSGETFLADHQGFFITQPRYEAEQGFIKPISALSMQHCLLHENGEALDLDYRNISIIHGFQFVPEIGGGCIMAHINQAEAFAPLQQLSLELGAAVAFILLLAWLIASMIGKRLSQPILVLSEMARDLPKESVKNYKLSSQFKEINALYELFKSMSSRLTRTIQQLKTHESELEEKIAERTTQLFQRHRKYHSVIQTAAEGFWQVDKQGWIKEANPAYARLSGYSEDELLGMRISDLEVIETPEETEEHILKVIRQGSDTFETQHRRKDGSIWDVEVNTSFIKEDEDYFVAFFKDITERKQIEQELRIAASAFETQEGIMITSVDGKIVRVNRAFSRITGYAAEEVVGKDAAMLRSGRHDRSFYKAIQKALQKEGSWEGEVWDHHKDGHIYPQWLAMTAVKSSKGQINHYVSNFIDITERKASEEKIKSMAFYDTLTGLPNRRLLSERLEHAIDINVRTGHHGALLFLDLDNFKTLNDTQGHGMGDELLIEVAHRLKACVRKADTVARLGGDEFIVLMEKFTQSNDQVAVQVKTVAEKIITALSQPYHLSKSIHSCSCSIGVVLFNSADISSDNVLSQADTAMYAAKKSGKNAYRFFDQHMQQELEQRSKFEAALRQAIENNQLELYFQPQCNSKNHIVGAEALLRWHHPELALIAPAQFMPLAEETGVIHVIGRWVLETACRQLEAWKKTPATENLTIAINISAKQFHHPDFVESVRESLVNYNINPAQLILELTEKMVLEKINSSVGTMLSLKALGVLVSLDDFGTGYASLSFLRTLPLDQIKIDQSFVAGIQGNNTDSFIVSCLLNLGQLLAISIIAEGVETAEQFGLLKAMGCMAYQGHYFGRPAPIEELEKQLFTPAQVIRLL